MRFKTACFVGCITVFVASAFAQSPLSDYGIDVQSLDSILNERVRVEKSIQTKAERANDRGEHGLFVVRARSGLGIEIGDVIYGINDHRVSTLFDARNAVTESRTKDSVSLMYTHEGQSFVAVVRKAGAPPENTPSLAEEHEEAPPSSATFPSPSRNANRTPEPAPTVSTSPPSTFEQTAKAFGADQMADVNMQFIPGKFYKIQGVEVRQVTNELIYLTWHTWSQRSAGGGSHVTIWEDKPFAILTTRNPDALRNFNISVGWQMQAVGEFMQFRDVEMTSGNTQRLPVFRCVGMRVGTDWVNTQ